MEALELLKTRRCIRVYTDEPVEKSVLEDIVDCGRLAATARNEQPWEFVVVEDKAVREKIASMAPNGPFVATVPACVITLCKDGTYYVEDGSAATQNMLLAAHAHGLGACWVAGDKKPYAQAVLDLIGAPAGYKLVSIVTVGHVKSTPSPAKRSLADVIHWEKF
jgi:nitroreductase